MQKNLISIIILFCIGYNTAFSILTDNLSLVERQTAQTCSEIASKILSKHIKIKSIKISEHSSRIIFEDKLTQTLSSMKLLSDDSLSNILNISLIQNNVYYNPILSCADSLIREIRTSTSFSVISNNATILADRLLIEARDTISVKDIEWIERGEFPFAQSAIPSPEASWFDSVITPVIVFGSSLLTILLLFTIRSK